MICIDMRIYIFLHMHIIRLKYQHIICLNAGLHSPQPFRPSYVSWFNNVKQLIYDGQTSQLAARHLHVFQQVIRHRFFQNFPRSPLATGIKPGKA